MKRGLVLAALCACHGEPEPPPAQPSSPPALAADPVATGEEPTHGDAALPFTITNIKPRQARRLAPPFYGDMISSDVPYTYVEILLGGGTFGWLAQSGDNFESIELIPSTPADGAKVVHTFATAFEVYENNGGTPGPRTVQVKILAHANNWYTTRWSCNGAEIYAQYNYVARTGRFVQKNRDGSWNWERCLAGTLRDGTTP